MRAKADNVIELSLGEALIEKAVKLEYKERKLLFNQENTTDLVWGSKVDKAEFNGVQFDIGLNGGLVTFEPTMTHGMIQFNSNELMIKNLEAIKVSFTDLNVTNRTD